MTDVLLLVVRYREYPFLILYYSCKWRHSYYYILADYCD